MLFFYWWIKKNGDNACEPLIKFKSSVQNRSKKHTYIKMARLPLLDDLIDSKQFKSIESNEIHNFLNKYDKRKMKMGKLYLIIPINLTKE